MQTRSDFRSYMCSNHFAQVDDDAHTFRGLKSFQSLLKDLVRLKNATGYFPVPAMPHVITILLLSSHFVWISHPFLLSVVLVQNSVRRLRGNIIQKKSFHEQILQSDLCAGFAVHSGKYQKIKRVKWQMISFEWRRRLTCHRLYFQQHPSMARLTCLSFLFCVTNKLCLFLPHQNCKWGCAKIEQILKINNNMHATVVWRHE